MELPDETAELLEREIFGDYQALHLIDGLDFDGVTSLIPGNNAVVGRILNRSSLTSKISNSFLKNLLILINYIG